MYKKIKYYLYNGTIKRIKWTGQTDHILNVTVNLDVDESIDSPSL